MPDECIGNEIESVLVRSSDVGPRLNVRLGSFVDDAEVRDDSCPELVREAGRRSAMLDDGGHGERGECTWGYSGRLDVHHLGLNHRDELSN